MSMADIAKQWYWPFGPSRTAAAHRPLSSLLSPQLGFRLSLSVSHGSPTPSVSSTLTNTHTHRSPHCNTMVTYFHTHITLHVGALTVPISDLLAAGLKEETQENVTLIISDKWRSLTSQKSDLHGSEKCLSPPGVCPQHASACAPGWNAFATDSPGLGSSGLCGSGDTAPPAPPLCAPPPGDAAPPLPGLPVLRWSEQGPAASSCSLNSLPRRGKCYKNVSIKSDPLKIDMSQQFQDTFIPLLLPNFVND